MKTLTRNKGTLMAIAVFILVIFLYNLFFKSEKLPVVEELSATNVGDDLLKIYDELKSVTLDQEVFSSPGYLLLVDFNISIPQQIIGRPNPFDIIGRD